jgi:hypothetical protein
MKIARRRSLSTAAAMWLSSLTEWEVLAPAMLPATPL